MQKTFVLSTKSLLSSENSTQRFGADNEIVIPMAILENLQHFQGTIEEKKMAQTILEYVEHFPIDDLYHKGAKQENESILRICDDCPDEVIEINVSPLYKRCFQVCKNLSKTRKNVIFITKDPVIRMKAREIGIQAQNFKDDLFPKLSEQYTGRVVAKALESDIDRLMQEKEAPKEIIWEHEKIDWYPNLFLNVTTESASGSVIVRYDQNKKKLVPLRFSQRDYPDHLKTKNVGQLMAMECLLSARCSTSYYKRWGRNRKNFLLFSCGIRAFERIWKRKSVSPNLGSYTSNNSGRRRHWSASRKHR